MNYCIPCEQVKQTTYYQRCSKVPSAVQRRKQFREELRRRNEKQCPSCLIVKSRVDFATRSDGTGKTKARCKPCRHRDATYQKYHLKYTDYLRMKDEQKNCCAICGKHESKLSSKLCVDHDHKTKKVRKLLCRPCNSGIGMFFEDDEILRKALIYVLEHKGKSIQ